MSELSKQIAEQLNIKELKNSETGETFYTNISETTLEQLINLIAASAIESIKSCSLNSNDDWEDGLNIAQSAIRESFNLPEE